MPGEIRATEKFLKESNSMEDQMPLRILTNTRLFLVAAATETFYSKL